MFKTPAQVESLRRDNPALRPREYLRGPEGGPAQLALYRPDGVQMTDEDWTNPTSKTLAVALDGRVPFGPVKLLDHEGHKGIPRRERNLNGLQGLRPVEILHVHVFGRAGGLVQGIERSNLE